MLWCSCARAGGQAFVVAMAGACLAFVVVYGLVRCGRVTSQCRGHRCGCCRLCVSVRVRAVAWLVPFHWLYDCSFVVGVEFRVGDLDVLCAEISFPSGVCYPECVGRGVRVRVGVCGYCDAV